MNFPKVILLAIFDWPTCLATRRTQSRACWAIVTSPTVLPPQPKIFSLVALVNDIVRKNIYNAQLKSLLKSTYRTFYSDSRGHCACQNNMGTYRYEKLDSILGKASKIRHRFCRLRFQKVPVGSLSFAFTLKLLHYGCLWAPLDSPHHRYWYRGTTVPFLYKPLHYVGVCLWL